MTFNYIKHAFRDPREGKIVARYNLYGFPTFFQVCYNTLVKKLFALIWNSNELNTFFLL